MSRQLAKPVTPYWLDAQIGQEVWPMVGLSERDESGLSPHLLKTRNHGSLGLPIRDPKGQQGTPACWLKLSISAFPDSLCKA